MEQFYALQNRSNNIVTPNNHRGGGSSPNTNQNKCGLREGNSDHALDMSRPAWRHDLFPGGRTWDFKFKVLHEMSAIRWKREPLMAVVVLPEVPPGLIV
jgi:hypothetical protein